MVTWVVGNHILGNKTTTCIHWLLHFDKSGALTAQLQPVMHKSCNYNGKGSQIQPCRVDIKHT